MLQDTILYGFFQSHTQLKVLHFSSKDSWFSLAHFITFFLYLIR